MVLVPLHATPNDQPPPLTPTRLLTEWTWEWSMALGIIISMMVADLLYNDKWELAEARVAARNAYEADVFLLEEDHFVWLCEISLQLEDYDQARRWLRVITNASAGIRTGTQARHPSQCGR